MFSVDRTSKSLVLESQPKRGRQLMVRGVVILESRSTAWAPCGEAAAGGWSGEVSFRRFEEFEDSGRKTEVERESSAKAPSLGHAQ